MTKTATTTTVLAALGMSLSMTGIGAGAAPRIAVLAAASQGTITTFAGGGVGDGRLATRSVLLNPIGVAVDGAGNEYIADAAEDRVRVVRGGVMTTLAGTGDPGISGDGGPATAARFSTLRGIAADRAGTVYVSDWGVSTANGGKGGEVRRIDTHGVITLLASGLSGPEGLAVSPDGGTVYVADANRILAIPAAGGTPTTVAGVGVTGPLGQNVAVGYGYGDTGDALPATESTLSSPQSVAADSTGDLYIADTGDQVVRRVSLSKGTITTVLGTSGGSDVLHNPVSVAVDSHGRVYVSEWYNGSPNGVPTYSSRVLRIVYPGSPGTARTVSQQGGGSLAMGPHDEIYEAVPSMVLGSGANGANNNYAFPTYGDGVCGFTYDRSANACVIDPIEGSVVAGNRAAVGDAAVDGQPATDAFLGNIPSEGIRGLASVTVDPAGQAYLTDAAQAIRVDTSGVAWAVAGSGWWSPKPVAPDGWSQAANSVNPEGSSATKFPLQPMSVASDGKGSVYVSDWYTHRVLRVDAHGVLHDFAGNAAGTPGITGDGFPATSVSLGVAVGLLAAPDGSVYFIDSDWQTVRRVDRRGIITTVAGSPWSPLESANLLGGERGNGACAYGVSRQDGQAATQVCLSNPSGLAMDAKGNLYIAEAGADVVDKVTPAGTITVVAGTSAQGAVLPTGSVSQSESVVRSYCGDGGSATAACLNQPQAVAVDAAGDLFIADTGNRAVRKVDTAGTITTVIGNVVTTMAAGAGSPLPPPDRGDGGPATSAYLISPVAVAVDSHGTLFVADQGDGRVREVGGVAAAHGARAVVMSPVGHERLNHTL